MEIFKTGVFNIEDMSDRRFLVPTYQRPYVWSSLEVEKLLFDFSQAYKRDDDHYYIGTILQYKNVDQQGEVRYELIDGQQRFTTLWLIAMAFKMINQESKLSNFLTYDSQLRFDFSIRFQLRNYLEGLLHLKDFNLLKNRNDSVVQNDYVKNVHEVIITTVELLRSNEFEIDSLNTFAEYINNKIKFVVNETPKTNLNKLFTTINSTGIQLNQSDILKSNLLKHMYSERVKYAKIWEACQNMNNYFESNVRALFPKTEWQNVGKDYFQEFNEDIFKYQEFQEDLNIDGEGFSIGDAIRNDVETVSSIQDDTNYQEVRCESIINFPILLLHTLRMYLFEKERADFSTIFHEKNLIEAFHEVFNPAETENIELEVKEFFLLLWKVRYIFDKNVIKWHQVSENEKILLITSIQEDRRDNTKYFSRNKTIDSIDGLEMLQSVQYFIFDSNTHYWLTPFLYKLLNYQHNLEGAINILERIDNEMSLTQKQLRITGWDLMTGQNQYYNKLDIGKGYPNIKRYWFQKLEYILWKQWEDRSDSKFTNYRITSRNSVEHVFPQNEENQKKIEETSLHSFGNLGLLNVEQNSSYSNQDVNKKKIDFNNKAVFDSLKLAKFYNSEGFDLAKSKEDKEELIKQHQKEMISLLQKHYNHDLPNQ